MSDWPLILAYHHITERPEPSRYATSAADLERQLRRLLDAGYKPLSLADAVAVGAFGTDERPADSFSVTFDDGFASFSELAVPVLERLGLVGKTTVFVPTAYVGGRNDWITTPTLSERLKRTFDLAAPLMDWDDIARLARVGVDFGSHGHDHLPMNSLSYDDAFAQSRLSREALAAHGIDARYLALPYGWASPTTRRAIADAGYDAAFAVERGGTDRFAIRRIPVYSTDSAVMARLKFSGNYFRVHDSAARLVGKGPKR